MEGLSLSGSHFPNGPISTSYHVQSSLIHPMPFIKDTITLTCYRQVPSGSGNTGYNGPSTFIVDSIGAVLDTFDAEENGRWTHKIVSEEIPAEEGQRRIEELAGEVE
jgi:hypothetical protein